MAPHDRIYGVQEVYSPSVGEPDIDIVAVHGLDGDARKTWTTKGSQICWLDNEQFLPKYIKNARVLVWGYNASSSSLRGVTPSHNRIHQHAQTLVANLTADRRLARTTNRPIIFLCHSLGGIIVKRALIYSKDRTARQVSHEYDIFCSTFGILFFATPHSGSPKASWGCYLDKMSRLINPQLSRSELLPALEVDSETLQNITDQFVAIMRNFRIYFFWEEQKTDLKVLGKDYIVSVESAAPKFDFVERAGIAADHSGIVKLGDPKSQAFKMVIDALLRYTEAAAPIIRQRTYDAVNLLDSLRLREAVEAVGGQGPRSLMGHAGVAMKDGHGRQKSHPQ